MNNLNFTEKELRDIINYETVYEQILELEKEKQLLPYALFEKQIKSYSYLYIQKTATNKPTSVGSLNDERKQELQLYKEKKQNIENRLDTLGDKLEENIKYFRLSKANRVEKKVADILRKLDVAGSLGRDILVVGTNAFVAYEIHAQSRLFNENMITDDFDLTWYRPKWNEKNPNIAKDTPRTKLFSVLKALDPTYTINNKHPYQATNSEGYEVELLCAPSVRDDLTLGDAFQPMRLEEQEWLLKGEPVRHILLSTDLRPAPIVAPDPRWMALHKLWLSKKPGRNPAKIQKDFNQGHRLLELVISSMSNDYPIDNNFIQELPKELKPILDNWLVKNNVSIEKTKKFNLF